MAGFRLPAALLLGLLGLLASSPPSAAAEALLLPCGAQAVDVGEPGWRWALLSGFHGDEPGDPRSAAWTRGEAAVVLVAGGAPAERLAIDLAPAAPGQRLTVSLAGRSLGTRELRAGWRREVWQVPAGAAGPGPVLLRLGVSETHRIGEDPRDLGVRIDRVALEPAPPCPGSAEARALPDAAPVRLERGAFLVLPVPGLAAPRLEAAAVSPAGGELRAWAVAPGRVRPAPPADLPARAAAEPRLLVPSSGRAALFVLQAGGGPVRLDSVRVREEESGLRRRLACGVVLPEAALLLGLLALLAGALVLTPRLPDRWEGAAGLLLVVLTAAAARMVFLAGYPEPAHGGDAWEYLMRSRLLASGEVPFLDSTRWHAWQTWIRPPGYYLFLAGLHRLPGGWGDWMVGSQALFSVAAAGAVYLLGRTLFGRAAGLAAGLLFALSAESVVTVSRVLGEPLYMLFLVPALVALARASVAPSWRWAAAAGALFGIASYVRSAPIFFVPLAALLLLWVHGPRRGWKPAAGLVAALALAVAPWVARNSALYGAPVGMDDLTVINLLQVWPDEELVPTGGADLDDPREYGRYYDRLKRANRDGALTRQAGEVTRRTLARMARNPVETGRRFGANVAGYFGAYEEDWLRRSLGEGRICRRILVTDLINAGTYGLLALALLGLALHVRRRAIWPVVAWFLFNGVVVNLLFHPEPKYRFPTLPVAFVLAGAAVAWLVSRRTRDGGAAGEAPVPRSPAG